MSAVIIIEIIAAILVLAAVVRYAVRDNQRRAAESPAEHSVADSTPEVPAHEPKAPAEQPLHEVADQA